MTYKEALDYLYKNLPMFHRIGPAAFKPDLSNSIALSAHLGHPQQQFKSIHIAGTNGKGSTAHLLAAVLQSAGYKVGLYTSPHYIDFRERIKVNGQYISEQEVIDFVSNIDGFVERHEPSFFELTVGMAFDHFRRHQVDWAVVETGLGGRLDATNILFPECCVITNIDFDHEQFLGNSLDKIAAEKAGIIKPNTPIVVGEDRPETRPVFVEKAQMCNAPLLFAARNFEVDVLESAVEKLVLNVFENGVDFLPHLELSLSGNYQIHNLKTVLATVKMLNQQNGLDLKKAHIRNACLKVRELTNIIGRWEILQKENPLIIGDSAHNPHGLRYVSEALKKIPKKQLHIVFGMVSDKAPEKLLSELPTDAIYYFCKADLPRALATDELLKAAAALGLKAKAFASVNEAFGAAKSAATANDLIFVGGSIFVLGELLAQQQKADKSF